MLTISGLASYAGVTVATIRHYHRVGLLVEPERDCSGYRTYDAEAVVRLIRIRVLAEAGVPLSRVEELLDASPEDFATAVREIDGHLLAEVGRLQETRGRLAQLVAGDNLALPASVTGYLDRLRGLGVAEDYLTMERDAWIMLAAETPDRIDEIIAAKHAYLDDPDTVRLYVLLGEALHWSADDPRVVELADILERAWTKATATGEVPDFGVGDTFVQLLDERVAEGGPVAQRVISLLRDRGWRGWTRMERHPTPSSVAGEGAGGRGHGMRLVRDAGGGVVSLSRRLG